MALYEVKVMSQYYNQSCISTFHYTTSNPQVIVSRSFALAAAMGFVGNVTPETGDIYGNLKTVSSSEVSFTEVQVSNVYDQVDFYVQPLIPPNVGLDLVAPEPPSVAYALQTNRVRRDIRRGNKRLVGVVQGSYTDGGALSASYLTVLQNLADDMSASLTYTDEGSPLTFVPVVVSKESYVAPSGNTAYRYYATETEQELHVASGVLWSPRPYVSTQVSRKRGRGS